MIEPHPPEPHRSLTGSNRLDIFLGFLAAAASWVLGGFLAAATQGATTPLLFAAFVIGCVVLMSRERTRVFGISMAYSGVGIPVAILFALIGMCSLGR